MDIQQYISSGIIEAYVLGIAHAEEIRELEQLAATHPEIAAAIKAYQQDLENFGNMYAIDPPATLKEEIWSQLSKQEEHSAQKQETNSHTEGPNIINFTDARQKGRNSKMAIAATVFFLVASLMVNFILWNKVDSSSQQIAQLKEEQKQDAIAQQQVQQELSEANNYIRLATDPKVKSIALTGVGVHTANQALVLWDTRTKDVYLMMNNIPPAPEGKQYQLWAIVDGNPVDLGVFDNIKHEVLQKMKVTPNAQMFAVTLEQSGGSPGPTMDQMYVAGKV